MRKLTLVLSTAALALSGAAYAQAAPQNAPEKMRAPRPDMTRADVQARAEARFARMDANSDGTLNETDRAARKAKMFDRLDADKDGAISQAELESRRAEHAGRSKARMARREGAPTMTDAQKAERRAEMFARIDTDKNGSLSRAEFEAMHGARGERMARRAAGRKPGAHHGMAMGGPVTKQAFVDRALARFDRTDADRDGTVTQAERKAARDAMRQQWQAKRQQG